MNVANHDGASTLPFSLNCYRTMNEMRRRGTHNFLPRIEAALQKRMKTILYRIPYMLTPPHQRRRAKITAAVRQTLER